MRSRVSLNLSEALTFLKSRCTVWNSQEHCTKIGSGQAGLTQGECRKFGKEEVCEELMRKCSAQARELLELNEVKQAAIEGANYWEEKYSQLEKEARLKICALNGKIDALGKELNRLNDKRNKSSAQLDIRRVLSH